MRLRDLETEIIENMNNGNKEQILSGLKEYYKILWSLNEFTKILDRNEEIEIINNVKLESFEYLKEQYKDNYDYFYRSIRIEILHIFNKLQLNKHKDSLFLLVEGL